MNKVTKHDIVTHRNNDNRYIGEPVGLGLLAIAQSIEIVGLAIHNLLVDKLEDKGKK